jgi:hypothetical protein
MAQKTQEEVLEWSIVISEDYTVPITNQSPFGHKPNSRPPSSLSLHFPSALSSARGTKGYVCSTEDMEPCMRCSTKKINAGSSFCGAACVYEGRKPKTYPRVFSWALGELCVGCILFFTLQECSTSQVPVTHTCSPS